MGKKAKVSRGVLRDGLQLLACGEAAIGADVTVKTFTSELVPGGKYQLRQGLGAAACSDHKALVDVRYLVAEGSAKAAKGPLGLPIDFLVKDLFAIDVSSDESMLGFFARWGIPCVPLFESRARCYDVRHLEVRRERAESEVLAEQSLIAQCVAKGKERWDRERDPLGERGHRAPETMELAYAVSDALSLGESEASPDVEKANLCVSAQRETAALSEAIRIETFMLGGDPCGIVSWDEAVLALRLLRECIAYALAKDVAPERGFATFKGVKVGVSGKGVAAKLMVDELHVTPELLCGSPRGFDYSSIDLIGEWWLNSDDAVLGFLNACMRSGGPLEVSRLGGLEQSESVKRRAASIEKVIATHAFQLLSLDLPWRRCEAPGCGVYYKVPMRRVGDSLADHLGHRERASSYCCAACQRRAKRAAKARARRIAGEMVARNIHIYVDADGKAADRVVLAREALLREANSRAAREGGVKKMVSDGTMPSDPRDAVPALLTMSDVDKIVEKAAAKAGLA